MLTRATSSSEDPLRVQVSQPAPCQQRLQITLATTAIQPVREVVLKEFQKGATIAGFRKGKAPRELVERQFTAEIREETLRRLTRQVFEQVAEERKLKPVGPFEVIKLNFDEQKGLELEAQVEVEPEFKLGDYRGIKLVKLSLAVTPEEIQHAVAQLQESAAELVPVPQPPASGSPAEGSRAQRGTGEGVQKEKRLPALDDEFAKDVGFESLEQLRTHVEAKLREHKQARQRQALEQALCDALLTRHQFEVPPRLVARQAERLRRDFQVKLLLSGLAEDKAKDELDKYTEQLRSDAIRHVKLSFLLERIAEKEALAVTQDEVVDRLWKLARRWGKDPGEVRRLLDEQGLWPSVLSSIRQDKAMDFLLSVAQIEEPTTT